MPADPDAVEIRPFRRDDRAQVVRLVNVHVGALLPGVGVSTNAVLSQLEREPREAIVDPWVGERATLVAIAHHHVVAAAHLLRYRAEPDVGPGYRDAGEIRWLIAWPAERDAAARLTAACVELLHAWGVTRLYADGGLPAPAVYGVPEAWPHVHAAYVEAGFAPGERVERVLLADVAALPSAAGVPSPVAGVTVRRRAGDLGTWLEASTADGARAGFVEVDADLADGGAHARLHGWADVANLRVEPALRRRGLGTWLLGHAADWLRLGGVTRLLAYTIEGETDDEAAFLAARGFTLLSRTRRGYERDRRAPG